MTFYNKRNGWTDNGKPINPKNTKCPNCKRDTYVESVSREYCSSCGMECNYWGGGTNDIYENMMKRNWAEQDRRREKELRKYYEDNYGESYDD